MRTDHQRLPVTSIALAGRGEKKAEDIADTVDANFQFEVAHPLHELIASCLVFVGQSDSGASAAGVIDADGAQSGDLRQQLRGID